ncbi:S41 family peptidase [Pedobacter gandavensis]|uniref:S41 family peptidase n=1 Tax=Pedobacter gandavensis TaxID=2679963 RepID=UPI0029301280|nr:S41 family peptidase [Pedobacter gandavensis]
MKHLSLFLFTLLISLGYISSGYAQKLNKQQQLDFAEDLVFKKHQPIDLVKDIKFVRQKLNENHPNLYWYISKDALNQKFDSLEKAITQPITSMQFRAKLMSVISDIGDGHIEISSNLSQLDSVKNGDKERFNKGQLSKPLPLSIRIFEGKMYVSSNQSNDSTVLIGGEILEIDNHSSAAIVTNLVKTSIAADGYNNSFKINSLNRFNVLFSDVYSANYEVGEVVKFLIQQKGEIKTCFLKTERVDSSKTGATFEYKYDTFHFSPGIGSLAYVKIPTFHSNENDKDFSNFLAKVQEQKIGRLVIDLRDNLGGKTTVLRDMLAFLVHEKTPYMKQKGKGHLIKPFKDVLAANKITSEQYKEHFESVQPADSINFKGELFLFINGGSFSAASILPAALKGNKNVTLVGSETGGGANGCTAYVYYYLGLPTSKLNMRYGLVALQHPKQVKTKGQGVMPDVEIKYTLQDYLDKKDLEMDWIFKKMGVNF